MKVHQLVSRESRHELGGTNLIQGQELLSFHLNSSSWYWTIIINSNHRISIVLSEMSEFHIKWLASTQRRVDRLCLWSTCTLVACNRSFSRFLLPCKGSTQSRLSTSSANPLLCRWFLRKTGIYPWGYDRDTLPDWEHHTFIYQGLYSLCSDRGKQQNLLLLKAVA